MGNHRFRLSDMMPNAWFYKLKDMNNPTTKKPTTKSPPPPQSQKHQLLPNRASYYFPSGSPVHPKAFDTHFPLDSPRKSTTPTPTPRKPRRLPAVCFDQVIKSYGLDQCQDESCVYRKCDENVIKSSSCRGSVSVSDSDSDQYSHCNSNNNNSSSDIVLDVVGSDQLELRPILTKPPVKIKAHALRTGRRRRRSGGLSESFAVVKSSSDPKTDFRESMTEMIAENGLGSAKELEDLLACYLSLNSNEYHQLIVEVFQEIWFLAK